MKDCGLVGSRKRLGVYALWATLAGMGLLLAVGCPSTVLAETLYWKGSTSAVWSGANANWATDVSGSPSATNTPRSTSDVVLSANGATNKAMTLAANTEIKSLTINDSAATTITGYTLTISGASGTTGINMGSAAGVGTIKSNLSLAGSSQTVTINQQTALFTYGTLSSSGGFTKAGVGNLYLVGAASYSGTTTVNAGCLWVVTPSSLPSTGGLGTNVSVRAGAVLVLAAGIPSTGEFNGSQVTAFASNATWEVNSRIGIDTRDAGTTPFVVSGLPSKPFGLWKTSANTLCLSGTNSYTGATQIYQGTVQAGSVNAMPPQGLVTVFPGAVFDLNGFNQSTGSVADDPSTTGGGTVALGAATLTAGNDNLNTPFSGSIVGTGGVVKAGTGTWTLSGSNTYGGNTTLSTGVLWVAKPSSLPNWNKVTVRNGTGLAVSAGGTGEFTGGDIATLLSQATWDTGSAIAINTSHATSPVTLAPIAHGSGLIKNGSNTLVLTGSNTFTGLVEVRGGTLQAGAAGTMPMLSGVWVQNGATFDLNNFSQAIGSLADDLGSGGSVTLGTGMLVTGFDNQNLSFSGVISGSGEVHKAGSGIWTLSGSNSFTGATGLYEGTLRAGAANVISQSALAIRAGTVFDLNGFDQSVASLYDGWGSGGSVTLGGATLTVGSDNQNTSFTGSISGSGNVIKVGNGSWTLSGSNIYTGVTEIDGGSVWVGAVNTLSCQSAMKLGLNGSFSLIGYDQAIGSLADGLYGGGLVCIPWNTTLTTGCDNTSTTFSGTLYGSGSLTKTGLGTFVLTGNCGYSGSTLVSAGVLAVSGTLNNPYGGMAVSAGAKFAVSGGSVTLEGLVNNGTVEVSANGQLSPGYSFTNTGTLRLTGSAQFPVTQLTNNGMLDVVNWKGTPPRGLVNNGTLIDRSRMKIKGAISGKDYTITMMGYSGHSYQMQSSATLAESGWTNIGAPVIGADLPISFTHSGGVNGGKRFYRVQVSEAL